MVDGKRWLSLGPCEQRSAHLKEGTKGTNPPNSQSGKPMSFLGYLQWYGCEGLVTGARMPQRPLHYQKLKPKPAWEITHKTVSLELPVQPAGGWEVGQSPPQWLSDVPITLRMGLGNHLKSSFLWIGRWPSSQASLREGMFPGSCLTTDRYGASVREEESSVNR